MPEKKTATRTASLASFRTGSPRRRIVLTALKLAISATLLFLLLRSVQVTDILHSVRAANVPLFLLAVGLLFLRYALGAHRWGVLLKPVGVQARASQLFRSNLVAAFFSNFLPSIIGGEPVRVYDSWRFGAERGTAVSVVFLDRYIGLVALLIFAVGGMMASTRIVSSLQVPLASVWVAGGLLLMLLLLWIIFRPPQQLLERLQQFRLLRFGGFWKTLDRAIGPFAGRSLTLSKSLVLSLLLQACVIAHYAVLAAALDLPVPSTAFLVIAPLAVLFMMLPVSINAIGLRENAFIFFFSLYGVAPTDSIAFAWLALGAVVLVGVAGGVVLATRKVDRPASRARTTVLG